MRKTIFAGLTVLGPTESIYEDNGAFITRDRDEIDRGLQLGVKTHRHTGLMGLSDPAVAPSGTVVASGGQIEAGLSITFGYTLEDEDGGETLLSPTTTVTTPAPLDVPLLAPTAVADYSTGNLLTDVYTYALTYTDGEGGETPIGPAVTVERESGFANGRVLLTGLDDGLAAAGASGWRLFRAKGGGSYALLATGNLGDDAYTDDGTDSPNCDVQPPTDNQNSTSRINKLQVFIPSGGVDDAEFINVYASVTSEFGASSLLSQFPVASAGSVAEFDDLEFLDDSPPDVNRSYGGAAKIDPDTELVEFHWLRPVDSFAHLPPASGSTAGDVRQVEDEGYQSYQYTDDGWVLFPRQRKNREVAASGEVAFVYDDAGKAIDILPDTGQTEILIPSDAFLDLPDGSEVQIARIGSGDVLFVPSGGVTMRSRGGASGIPDMNGVVTARKRNSDDWLLYGDL